MPRTKSVSGIAQKLCEELVNPAWISYKDDTLNASSKNVNGYPSKTNANPGLHPVIVEKKRVISKVLPNTSKLPNGEFQCKHLSKNSFQPNVLRRVVLVNKGLNTLISGPLRCDNNCVTVVQKRDKVCCRCTHQSNIDTHYKGIQTMDSKRFTILSNKACSHCVQMVCNSTQYIENLENLHIDTAAKLSQANIDKPVVSIPEPLKTPIVSGGIKKIRDDIISSVQIVDSKPTYLNNFKGAHRWAISQCPVLGPDF